MEALLRERVWQRAGGCCEYCRMPRNLDVLPFQIDHVVAEKHGGATVEGNLALSCALCNAYKGPNIAGIDPTTLQLTRLFSPRIDAWSEHFEWDGPRLRGLTPVGRATIAVLRINEDARVEHRRVLIATDTFPS